MRGTGETKWAVKFIFIASPGDLAEERRRFPTILEKLNDLKAHGMGVHLEPLGWEDTQPGRGRPQALINKDLEKCHLFIMLLWKRWGTRPGGSRKYSSGTQEEYEMASDLHSKRGFPDIYLYFRDVPEEMLADPGKQLSQVLKFKEKIESERMLLFKRYASASDWEYSLMSHISQWLDGLEPDAHESSVESSSMLARRIIELEGELLALKRRVTSVGKQPSSQLVKAEYRSTQEQLRELALNLQEKAAAAASKRRIMEAEVLYAEAVETYPELSVINEFGLFYLREKSLSQAEKQFLELLRLAEQQGDSDYRDSARASLSLILQMRDDRARPAGIIDRRSGFAGIIQKKRDGLILTRNDIHDFVHRYTVGEIPDYQAAALLMAIYSRGLDETETADLTEAMMRSGQVLDLSKFSQPKIGRHSTGGVGDKASLVLVAVAAAGGVLVPMIGGRGLGYSGGTLDKLESIPGFNVRLSIVEFVKVLESCGCAIMAQTAEIAPADRMLYALRDGTITVESIPLISASIMAKKLAEGIDGLLVDVKVGSGSFLKQIDDARQLTFRLAEIGVRLGKRVRAVLTNMDQPLGYAVGNALEMIECIETLKGRGPADIVEICRELAAHMFLLGNIDGSLDAGRLRFDSVCANGQALGKFAQLITAQGGDPRVVDDYSLLGSAKHEEQVIATESGYITALQADTIGWASVLLGAGREQVASVIDPLAGVVLRKKIGDRVEAGEAICTIYANKTTRLPEASDMILSAVTISAQVKPPEPLILQIVGQ